MTPEQKDYAKNIAIASLAGGVTGGLIGQFASEERTMGKTLLGGLIGAALVGIGYGFYLRTGGAPEGAFGLGMLRNVRLVPHAAKAQMQMAGLGVKVRGCSGCVGRTSVVQPGTCFTV